MLKEFEMYKNKNGSRNNICGSRFRELRLKSEPFISQRAFADKMQLIGIDLDKNAIKRIESGQRFITDIELIAFAQNKTLQSLKLQGSFWQRTP